MNDEPWQDLDPAQQVHLVHDTALGVQPVGVPGGGAGAPVDTPVI
jgi:hypothetical protein